MADPILQGQRARWYPTAGQRALAWLCFDQSKMVYNQALAQMETAYRSGEKLSILDVSKLWTQFKKSAPEHRLVPRSVTDKTLRQLDSAYRNFFGAIKNGVRAGFPKPKGKLASDKFTIKVDYRHVGKTQAWSSGRLLIPGFGLCKMRGARIEGLPPKSATVSRDPTGRYWISFANDRSIQPIGEPSEGAGSMVGIDLGIKTFATLSDGTAIANPRHLNRRLKALRYSQRALARCQAKSRRRAKRRLKVARLHAQVAQARENFLHQTSTAILKRYSVVAVEDLNVLGMVKNRRLARHISDLGLGRFVAMLKYKSQWHGRGFLQCGRFDPSSQSCSACGDRGVKLPLSVREWDCQKCGAHHDRDLNASINVLKFALAGNARSVEGEEPAAVSQRPMKREPLALAA